MTDGELFMKGYQARRDGDLVLAEQCFLAGLRYHCEQTQETGWTTLVYGIVDGLALGVYPMIDSLTSLHSDEIVAMKSRARSFYEILSQNDRNAAYGYALAMVNGTFGEPDLPSVMQQLSKADYYQQVECLGAMLRDGLLLDQDINAAAILFASSHRFDKQYEALGVTVKLSDDELWDASHEIVDRCITPYADKLNRELDKNELLHQFMSIPANAPTMDFGEITPEPDRPVESATERMQRNIANLLRMYDECAYQPILRPNPKHMTGEYEDMVAYIAFEDLHERKFNIRVKKSMWDTDLGSIIISYNTADDLFSDGWLLD
jgi:hypothetical protein